MSTGDGEIRFKWGGFAPCVPRKARNAGKSGGDEGGLQGNYATRPLSARPFTSFTRNTEKIRSSHEDDTDKSQSSAGTGDCKTANAVSKVELQLWMDNVTDTDMRLVSRKIGNGTGYEQDAGLSYGYLRPRSQKFTRFLRKNAGNYHELEIGRNSQKSPQRGGNSARGVRAGKGEVKAQVPAKAVSLVLAPHVYRTTRLKTSPRRNYPRYRPVAKPPQPRYLTPAPRQGSADFFRSHSPS